VWKYRDSYHLTDTQIRAGSVSVCFEPGDVFLKPGHDDKMIRKTRISVDHNNGPNKMNYLIQYRILCRGPEFSENQLNSVLFTFCFLNILNFRIY
jgi:hypothetical protein